MNFVHADIKGFLESPPESYDPPVTEAMRVELSMIMACCVVVRALDERRRRLDPELADLFEEVRASIGAMDSKRSTAAAKALLEYIGDMNYKLVPIPLLTLKTLTWALVDAGTIGVPATLPKEEADKEIVACRKALEMVASELCLKFGVPHKSEPN